MKKKTPEIRVLRMSVFFGDGVSGGVAYSSQFMLKSMTKEQLQQKEL